MLQRKTLTKEQAYQKLKHFCAYQERCHREVKRKASALGLKKRDAEELVSKLIGENCLNEERFAIQFAGGKFRIKQWGRIKIKYELKQKSISEYCIRKALSEIGEEEYRDTLNKTAMKKWNSIKNIEVNQFVKMGKTRDFLIQKGFEPALVMDAINKMKK